MRDLLINACVLFTITCLAFLPFRYQRINTTKNRIMLGLMAGVAGIILMYFTLVLPDGLILDLRLIPIVTAATYGGLTASLPAAIIIAIGRMVLFGFSQTAASAAANVIVIGLVSAALAKLVHRRRYRLLVLNIYALIQTTFLLRTIDITLISAYWLTTIAMGVLVQWVIEAMATHYNFQAHLKELAEIDYLTGLMNARQFDYMLRRTMQTAERSRQPFCLLLLDIDHFKHINDTYGHPAGDNVLRQIAIILQQSCRPGDSVARKGGEEFAIILPTCTVDSALGIAERIRTAVSTHAFHVDDHATANLTISIGVSRYQNGRSTNTSQLVEVADEALYQAKNGGRNKVCSA